MRVLVHLVYFAPGKIRPVTIPDNTSPENLLDTVFHYGQNDVQPLSFPSVSMGDIIENPFDGRLYRVEMMGFKALPTGSGPYSTNPSDPVGCDWRANPLDTSGMICDFCGKPGITQIIFCRPFMLGRLLRAQFAACDTCVNLINTQNTRQLITNACNMMPAEVRRAGRVHFAGLYQTLISHIIAIRAVTPQDIFDLFVARATSMHQKCQLRTGHPVIGECNDLAYVEVETPDGWKKSCSTCAAQHLGLKEVVDIVCHQKIRSLRASRRNPRLTKSGPRVLANRKLLREWKPEDLSDNIIIVGPFGPTAEFFGHDKTTHLLYFLQDEADRPAVIDRIKSQDLAIFQPHVPLHLLWRGTGSISLFWKHSLAKKYLAGALQYHFETWPSGEVLVLTHMAVKSKWRRNKLNSLMIDFLHSEYPNHRILFHELTQDGKAFMKVYGGEEYQAAWNREPKV